MQHVILTVVFSDSLNGNNILGTLNYANHILTTFFVCADIAWIFIRKVSAARTILKGMLCFDYGIGKSFRFFVAERKHMKSEPLRRLIAYSRKL